MNTASIVLMTLAALTILFHHIAQRAGGGIFQDLATSEVGVFIII